MTTGPVDDGTNGVRARSLGIPFRGTPGSLNAITDVPGVEVGMRTLISGEGALRVGRGPVRTGVTVILPRGRAGVGEPCASGVHVLNGNGEMTGAAWIAESGSLSMPIVLTNSHAIGAGHRGAVEWIVRHHPRLHDRWLLPVVAETYDGYLNDINGDHVRVETVLAAFDGARGGPVAEGSVGGGTGMTCYDFKGGTGTASRLVPFGGRTYTVAVLVQANFGARHELTLAGIPVGRLLDEAPPVIREGLPPGAGSVIAVVATDAPLLPGQCAALARRVPLGLARTGTSGSHFSGDLFLAFSTANPGMLGSRYPEAGTDRLEQIRFIPWGWIDACYAAVVDATEEAVVNALVAADTMTGRDGHRAPGLPHEQVRRLAAHARALSSEVGTPAGRGQ